MIRNTHTNKNQFYTTKQLTRISMIFQEYTVNCHCKQFLNRINS